MSFVAQNTDEEAIPSLLSFVFCFFLIHMSLEWQLLNVWAWASKVVIWFLLFTACVCSCQNHPLLMM